MDLSPPNPRRYRFGDFTLSLARRALARDGQELPLIPRYFDLLVLLVERRNEAVHRRDLLEAVWTDVVVSDGALSQAIRTLRRTLGDDPRSPRFIRTVARHGYRFVFPEVVEESDGVPPPRRVPQSPEPSQPSEPGDARPEEEADRFEEALSVLLDRPADGPSADEEERRDAAERLHLLGTTEALERLGRRSGHARARALLRDARWDVPGAGPVPILGAPGALRALVALVGLRTRRMLRVVGRRWAAGVLGGAGAGGVAGLLGGIGLRFGPGSQATDAVLVALPLFGGVVGGLGALGVAGGLVAAEATLRSVRGPALVVLGALGGAAVGATAHLIGSWAFEGLFGRPLAPVAGGFEGLVLGGAIGLGYALSAAPAGGGMAAPRGRRRWIAVASAALTCAVAAALLGWTGSFLGAMSLDFLSRTFPGSQVSLAPLARLLGEQEPEALTRTAISGFEGLMFGAGLILGLTRRPSRR